MRYLAFGMGQWFNYSKLFYSNTDSSFYDLNKNTFVKEFYEKMSPFLKYIMNILPNNATITNIEKQKPLRFRGPKAIGRGVRCTAALQRKK